MKSQSFRGDTPLAKPKGGFVQVRTFTVGLAWWAFLKGRLSLHAIRVLLALIEQGIRRRAYVWTERRQGRIPDFIPRYTTRELATFMGLPEKKARAALRELEVFGLVRFSESEVSVAESAANIACLSPDERAEFEEWLSELTPRKRFPIPRSILALAAESSSRAFIAAVLGTCLRCSWYYPHKKEWRGRGRLSLAWLSDCFGVCPRALKSAKKRLMALGWIHQETTTRFGDALAINPEWERWAATKEGGRSTEETAAAAQLENAPLPPVPGPNYAPPKIRESLPTGEQNPRESRGLRPDDPGPGFFQKDGGGNPQDNSGEIPRPRLSAIHPEDFRDVGRALELFRQAVKCRLMPNDSEHARLRWLAAIERARTVPARNPAGVFLHVVKNRKWDYLSDGHYEAANARLKAHLHGPPPDRPPLLIPRTVGPAPEPPARPRFSRDALLLQVVTNELARRGMAGDVFTLLQAKAGFSRERFDAASAELGNPYAATASAV